MSEGKNEGDSSQLLTMLFMAQSLQKMIDENPEFDFRFVKTQYNNLLNKLAHLDSVASGFLSKLETRSGFIDARRERQETKLAVGLLMAFLTTKSIPTFMSLMGTMKELGFVSTGGPFERLTPLLQSVGLTVNWAIAAAELSFIEVIITKKLAELGEDQSGEFEKRLNRLNTRLKEKGIEIPALMLSGLYKVRSKVVHEGREPTSEEMRQIGDILGSLFQKVKSAS